MNWNKFYREFDEVGPSPFAKFVLNNIKGKLIDLGAGNGRDVNYFLKNGIDCFGIDKYFGDINIIDMDVRKYLKVEPPECVYTRFFWHSIDRSLQLKILKWVKGTLFIEARTTEDKPLNIFGEHKRNLVDVSQLVKDLKDNDFQILYMREGIGLSEYKGEDPHLIRIICKKV